VNSCKPQLAAHLLLSEGMSQALEGKLLISILAGTTIGMMREWVPSSCTVVRSMPNTPSKVSSHLSSLLDFASVRLIEGISERFRFGKE